MLYNIFRRTPVVYERLLAVLFIAFLTGVMAQIKVYLPGNPVPITMQVLAVILTGLMLRPSDAPHGWLMFWVVFKKLGC
jgi:biotin transporter BioY